MLDFWGCIFFAILMSLTSGKVPLIVNENSFIQMGAEPPNHSNIDTPTPILDFHIRSQMPIYKNHFSKMDPNVLDFFSKWMLWLDGRLMVQEAVQMPHTELHGMDEAKARKSAKKIGWKA